MTYALIVAALSLALTIALSLVFGSLSWWVYVVNGAVGAVSGALLARIEPR